MDKAEIGMILDQLVNDALSDGFMEEKDNIKEATSSITALIIKWLEGKKVKIIEDCWENVERDKNRNQLITELIGELE